MPINCILARKILKNKRETDAAAPAGAAETGAERRTDGGQKFSPPAQKIFACSVNGNFLTH